MLVLVLLGLLSLDGASSQMSVMDNPLPADSDLLMPVTLGDAHSRERREAVEMTQPIRILPYYADNFDASLQGKSSLIREDIIPKLLDFLGNSLKVAPLTGPILINNQCTTSSILRNLVTGEITCFEECAATTMCGFFPVPTQHLKQCCECRGSTVFANCVVGTPAQDGEGVSGYDFILYVMADQSICPSSSTGSPTTLAFASACENENVQDRPVAGYVNFCPDAVRDGDRDFAFSVTKHEVLHALAFSSSLLALWRDPANNEPRTPRNGAGLPNVINGAFEISNTTVQSVTYTDWLTESGRISHTVSRLVTSAVRTEARSHFNCPTLSGVELENQGGSGTAISHWEKRVLGNEAMTGILSFNPVFSRFTFALLEDSGWYTVNYSLADELIWGRGAGCRFAEGSCREWIDTQNSNNQPISPFCVTPQNTTPRRTSCTVDHEAVARCNLVTFTSSLPVEYQYFSSPQSGGSTTVSDFCPFQNIFSIRDVDNTIRGTTCSVSSDAPINNQLLERYGPGSRCVLHGRQWTINSQPISVYGGGCYQYSCTGDSVTITIETEELTCTCSQAGEEIPSRNIAPKDPGSGSTTDPPAETSTSQPTTSPVDDITTTPPAEMTTEGMMTTPPVEMTTEGMMTTPPVEMTTEGMMTTPPAEMTTEGMMTTPPAEMTTEGMMTTPPVEMTTEGMMTTPPTEMSTSSTPGMTTAPTTGTSRPVDEDFTTDNSTNTEDDNSTASTTSDGRGQGGGGGGAPNNNALCLRSSQVLLFVVTLLYWVL